MINFNDKIIQLVMKNLLCTGLSVEIGKIVRLWGIFVGKNSIKDQTLLRCSLRSQDPPKSFPRVFRTENPFFGGHF